MDEWTIKTRHTKPYMLAFLSVDLLTDFAAFCLTVFIDWRYIHSWFVFLTQLGNWTVAPMDEGTIPVLHTCVLLPPKEIGCPSTVPSLWPPPPSPPSQCTVYSLQTVSDCGGGGGLKCTVDHILQEFYTLFLTRFKTYKIASPPQTKMTNKGIGVFKVPSSMVDPMRPSH